MADISSSDSVHVTAEEHAHPAIRRLARALISLALLRRTEQSTEPAERIAETDREAEHG